MREVRAIVLVDRETESAFKGSDVVLEEIRVFLKIDMLEGEFAQPFAPVGIGS